MKGFFFISLVIIAISSCTSNKNLIKFSETKLEEGNDSTQYELLVFEPHFEAWYAFQNSPAQYHSQAYYELWNKRYVLAWNLKAMDFRANKNFETIVGYEYTIDYGFELNHRLFHYFMYVENVLKIPIVENGPHFFRR